jgi:hypothetical protein
MGTGVLQILDWLGRRLERHGVCLVCGVDCGEVGRGERGVKGGETADTE